MKKIFLVIVAFLVLLTISSYIFIPSVITVSSAKLLGAAQASTERYLIDTGAWKTWWLSNDSSSNKFEIAGNNLICNGDSFHVNGLSHMAATVELKNGGKSYASQALIISKSVDSTFIQWACDIPAGSMPWERLANYQHASSIKKNIDAVIFRFQHFMENPVNVYGIPFARTSIRDTLFISKKQLYTTEPQTTQIYDQINLLKTYAENKGAIQTGSPIYNITLLDSSHYQLMTAIPVDKKLEGDATFSFKRMIQGSFIVSDIVGGPHAVDKASRSLDQFFDDYHKTAMAISFRMLITNRMESPDSSQWKTRLYHPIY